MRRVSSLTALLRTARFPRRVICFGVVPLLLAAGVLPTRGVAPPECASTLATERPIEATVSPVAATPAAVAMPAATGTPVANVDGVVLAYYRFLDDDIGGLFPRGEVVNTNPFAVLTPRLEFRLLDGDGRETEVVEGDPLAGVNLILPGGRMPITGYVKSDRGDWAREEIRLVPGRRATEQDRVCVAAGLRVEGVVEAVEAVVEGSSNPKRVVRLFVRGDVVNDGRAAAHARVHLVWSDASGRYVSSGKGDTERPVPPGGREPFETSILVSRIEPGWTYRLVVSGRLA